MSAPLIPAFDPQGADAEILEAFENIRAHRAWYYDQLARVSEKEHDKVFAHAESLEGAQLTFDAAVRDNWATSPSGVAAQLVLTMFDRGSEAWVDQGVMSQGVRALYMQRHRLDGQDRLLITAAYELLHIEYEQALEDYERSALDFNAVLHVKSLVEEESQRLRNAGSVSDHLLVIEQAIDALEERCSNRPQIDRLMHTLAPDWPAYKRKAEIAIAEDYAGKAAPWLVRDVNFLMGAIEPEAEAA